MDEKPILLTEEFLPLFNDMMNVLADNVKNAKNHGFSDSFIQGYRNAIADARKNVRMIVSQLAVDDVDDGEEE